jgi:hypothetical protein
MMNELPGESRCCLFRMATPLAALERSPDHGRIWTLVVSKSKSVADLQQGRVRPPGRTRRHPAEWAGQGAEAALVITAIGSYQPAKFSMPIRLRERGADQVNYLLEPSLPVARPETEPLRGGCRGQG